MKRAVITGCTGALGRALAEELVRENWQVIAVPRENSGRISAVPKEEGIKIVPCNLERMEELPERCKEPADVFFHLAWDGTYGRDREDCARQNRNVEYTLQAVTAAKKMGCSVFVGAGSQSEYGRVEGVLQPGTVCRPDSPYGAAKLSACHMSRILCSRLGIRQEWCRILSLYGPCDGEYTMIMSIIRSFLKGEKPACTKGEQVWDYLYSKDAARALRLAAEKGKDGAVYCLGSGESRLLREYITAVRDAAAPGLSIGFGERPYHPDQVMCLRADLSDLQRDTGFRVSYSFEEGIAETVRWCKENGYR